MKTFSKLGRQGGFSTISMIVLVGLIALVNLGLSRYQLHYASEVFGRTIGGQANNIKEAVDNYLKAYGPKIVAAQTVSDGTTSVANSLAPTLAELYAMGFLTVPLTTPINGGSWNIKISTQPSSCTLPGPCNLVSSIYATVPLASALNPSAIDGTALDAAVSQLNGDGGYSEVATPNVITIAGGATPTNPAGSVAGILYARGGYGSSSYAGLKNIGDGCSTPGAVVTSTTGQQLICRGSNYVTTLNALSNYREMTKLTVKDGDTVYKPACEAGGTPAFSIEMTQIAVDVGTAPPLQSLYETAQDQGSSWRVVIHMKDRNTVDTSANPYQVTAVFHVQCYYP